MSDRPEPPAILASDAEREQSIVLLQDAVVTGLYVRWSEPRGALERAKG